MKSSARHRVVRMTGLMSVICILFIISLAVLAYAEEDAQKPQKIFDDYVKSGDSFKAGKIKFETLWVDPSMLITFEGNSLNVPLGECRYLSPFNICLNKTRQLLNGEVLPAPIHSEDVETEMLVQVYAKLASLELTRDFGKQKLLIDEETTVRVEIKNTGLADATDVVFEDDYPSAVEVKKASGCDIDNNKVVWTGTLRKGNGFKCEYTIKAVKDKSFTSTASLEYYNGIDKKKVSDTAKLVILEKVIKPAIDLSATRLTIGDMLSILINLSNNYNETININKMAVSLPGSLKILDRGGLSDSNTWKGSISAGESQVFMLKAQAVRTGEYKVSLYAEYLASGVRQNASEQSRFKTSSNLDVEIAPNLDDQLKVGQEGSFMIKLINPSQEKPLLDLEANISSDLPGFKNTSVEKDQLGRNNELVVLDTRYTPEQAGNYYLNISVSYRSEFREKFVKTSSWPVKVSTKGSSQGESGPVNSTDEQGSNAPESQKAGNKSWLSSIKLPRLSLPSLSQFGTDEGRTAGLVMIGIVIIMGLMLLYLKHRIHS